MKQKLKTLIFVNFSTVQSGKLTGTLLGSLFYRKLPREFFVFFKAQTLFRTMFTIFAIVQKYIV